IFPRISMSTEKYISRPHMHSLTQDTHTQDTNTCAHTNTHTHTHKHMRTHKHSLTHACTHTTDKECIHTVHTKGHTDSVHTHLQTNKLIQIRFFRNTQTYRNIP